MTFGLKDDKTTWDDRPSVLEALDGFTPTPTLPDHALRSPAQRPVLRRPNVPASERAIDSAPVSQQSLAELADRLAALCSGQSAAERLRSWRNEVVGRIVFTTSFGLEDQVITHLLSQQGIDVDVVTLDTGRLFEETYAVWVATERRYDIKVRPYYPRRGDIEDLVARQGINGFYESKTARLACCQIRKVDPLNRALDGARGWITGLRSEQSAHRRDMSLVAADTSRRLVKLNPLFDWTHAQLLSFAAEHQIPVNSLHSKGFASIGCAPCTRAIAPNEPERAGRWWWEDDQKECGLHLPAA